MPATAFVDSLLLNIIEWKELLKKTFSELISNYDENEPFVKKKNLFIIL